MGARFHDHRRLVREIFAKRQILLPSAFAQVDWINVNKALHERSHSFSNFGHVNRCMTLLWNQLAVIQVRSESFAFVSFLSGRKGDMS